MYCATSDLGLARATSLTSLSAAAASPLARNAWARTSRAPCSSGGCERSSPPPPPGPRPPPRPRRRRADRERPLDRPGRLRPLARPQVEAPEQGVEPGVPWVALDRLLHEGDGLLGPVVPHQGRGLPPRGDKGFRVGLDGRVELAEGGLGVLLGGGGAPGGP